MKLPDRMLLHTIDATMPGGLPPRRCGALIHFITRVCIYLAVFVMGMAYGTR